MGCPEPRLRTGGYVVLTLYQMGHQIANGSSLADTWRRNPGIDFFFCELCIFSDIITPKWGSHIYYLLFHMFNGEFKGVTSIKTTDVRESYLF